MVDKPILFSAPMVRALLAGTKTQTRRVLNPQPYTNGFKYDAALGDILCHNDCLPPAALLMDKGKGTNRYTISSYEDGPEAFGRYRVGDRLYVREAWRCDATLDAMAPRDLKPRTRPIWFEAGFYGVTGNGTPMGQHHPADLDGQHTKGKFRQGMHMPRWASRITLAVTEVRVERLRDCSANDAIAEGVSSSEHWRPKDVQDRPFEEKWWDDATFWGNYPQLAYRELWEAINGPGSWAANPWVAAYSFTVHHHNIDQVQK